MPGEGLPSELEDLAELMQGGTAQDADDLRQKTIRLFGTDDLSQIFADLPDQKDPPGVMQDFGSLLLSHGVNPADIEGPLVQPPPSAFKAPVVSSNTAAEVKKITEAAPKPASSTAVKGSAGPAPDRRLADASSPSGKGKGKAAGKGGKGKTVYNEGDKADSGESNSEEDSCDEDFEAMRRAAKASSQETAEELAKRPAAFAPPPRRPPPQSSTVEAAAKAKAAAKAQFVRLALVESSGSEDAQEVAAVEEDPSDTSSDPSDEESNMQFGIRRDPVPMQVMSRLLSKAPEGDCKWDVWLDAARKWPQLKVRLNDPEFYRRGQELRVRFSVDLLKSTFEEHKKERAELRQKRQDVREKLKQGVNEFVLEAERRRAMMTGRFGGNGFVLAPRNPQLEETLRQQRQERQSTETEIETKTELPKETSTEVESRKAEKAAAIAAAAARKSEREEKAKAEKEAEKQKQEEEELKAKEAKRRRARLADVFAEIRKHREPLIDSNISIGVDLPSLSASSKAALAEAQGGAGTCSIFVLPWGGPAGAHKPSPEQRQALGLVLGLGLAQAMMKLPVSQIGNACSDTALAELSKAGLFSALLIVSSGSASAFQAALPSGIVLGPFAVTSSLADIFCRPLAMWAFEEELTGRKSEKVESVEETVCTALSLKQLTEVGGEALSTMLSELEAEGLSIAGLRLAVPNFAAAQAPTSAAQKYPVRAGEAVLLLAIRGPQALGIWRTMLGPADPQLARQTDPSSLNARFGGHSRNQALAQAPPSSVARAIADVAWAFGGRLDPDEAELPRDPVHSLQLLAPRIYALEICGSLALSSAGPVLGGLFLRAGRILSLQGAKQKLIVTAVRDGGLDATGCSSLLSAPPADLNGGFTSASSITSPTAARLAASAAEVLAVAPCAVQTNLALGPQEVHGTSGARSQPLPPLGSSAAAAADAELKEFCQLGQPEVLIVGLRPRGSGTPLLVQAALEGLFSKFGPQASRPSGLDVGNSVDLLGVRSVDFDLPESVAVDAEEMSAAIDALKGFRSFAQIVRRAADEASNGWWRSAAEASQGPATLFCFYGEGLISRFRTFLDREWKLTAATSGDVLFTPDISSARRAYRAFFSGLAAPSFQPTVPCSDLRSIERFMPSSLAEQLSEASCFPRRCPPELTVAVAFPPNVDSTLYRALTAVEQNGFTLVACVVSGRMPKALVQPLFDQEVADKHLEASDWPAFLEACGGEAEDEEDDDESGIRCTYLVLSRPLAVKRLAQLCGDGDPAVNQNHLHVALRAGRDRLHNGIRCATSCATAQVLLKGLEKHILPRLCPVGVPSSRRLGVDAAAGGQAECGFAALALLPESKARPALLVRDLQHELTKRGLAIIGLHFVTMSADASLAWPSALSGRRKLLEEWAASRPTSRLVDLALSGQPVVIAACEGFPSTSSVQAAVNALLSALPGSLETYVSPNPSEAASDVSHLFDRLCSARHYIVPGEDCD